MNNDIQFITNQLKMAKNPENFIMGLLEQNCNNPIFSNLLLMAKNGNRNGIELVARNILKEQGLDFDAEFRNFKSQIGIK